MLRTSQRNVAQGCLVHSFSLQQKVFIILQLIPIQNLLPLAHLLRLIAVLMDLGLIVDLDV
jgi:carotenoid cleavage dioxygenase-like enzyme